MQRFLTEEHLLFREAFRKYVREELRPHREEWDQQRQVPRGVWRDCGARGFLCPWVDEKYGGAGADFGYSYVIAHEIGRAAAGISLTTHSDIVVPYIASYGTDAQKDRWLPGCVTGDILTAIAMTEPDAGSDLQGLRTTAVRDGDSYVIDGRKMFITQGMSCDLVIVACRTDPNAHGLKALSLIVVEDGTPGFVKARKLNKVGTHCQDTAELLFEQCRVPAANLLGEENAAFRYMMSKLQRERLIIVIRMQAEAERVLELAVEYAKTRVAFGHPIGSFQHNQFKLAEMATEVALGRTFVDDLVQEYMDGTDVVTKVSMAKWWVAEMINRIAYHAVQLHGCYGYLDDYEISRLFRDARATNLAAGSTEIMKQTIAKRMGL